MDKLGTLLMWYDIGHSYILTSTPSRNTVLIRLGLWRATLGSTSNSAELWR